MNIRKSEEMLGPRRLWQDYREFVYPDGIGRDQDRDTALAFYAGVETAFRMIDKLVELDVNDEDSLRILTRFRDEVEAVAQEVNLDRANGDS